MAQPKKPTLQISGLPIRIFGFIYLYYWIHRTRLRRLFEKGSIVILGLYLATLAVELVLELVGSEWAFHPHWAIRAAFYVFFGLALYSKVKEWGEQRQEFFFIQAAKKVVGAFEQDFAKVSKEERIQGLLTIFVKNFEHKGAVNANLALPNALNGKLVVQYIHPTGAEYDRNLALAPGEGGSGYCYANGCVVYIPWAKLGHAVIQTIAEDRPYTLVEDLYVEDNIGKCRSILCLPVAARGHQYGVLNFDSIHVNAFRIIDFEQAMFFAFVLARLMQDLEAGSITERRPQ